MSQTARIDSTFSLLKNVLTILLSQFFLLPGVELSSKSLLLPNKMNFYACYKKFFDILYTNNYRTQTIIKWCNRITIFKEKIVTIINSLTMSVV